MAWNSSTGHTEKNVVFNMIALKVELPNNTFVPRHKIMVRVIVTASCLLFVLVHTWPGS